MHRSPECPLKMRAVKVRFSVRRNTCLSGRICSCCSSVLLCCCVVCVYAVDVFHPPLVLHEQPVLAGGVPKLQAVPRYRKYAVVVCVPSELCRSCLCCSPVLSFPLCLSPAPLNSRPGMRMSALLKPASSPERGAAGGTAAAKAAAAATRRQPAVSSPRLTMSRTRSKAAPGDVRAMVLHQQQTAVTRPAAVTRLLRSRPSGAGKPAHRRPAPPAGGSPERRRGGGRASSMYDQQHVMPHIEEEPDGAADDLDSALPARDPLQLKRAFRSVENLMALLRTLGVDTPPSLAQVAVAQAARAADRRTSAAAAAATTGLAPCPKTATCRLRVPCPRPVCRRAASTRGWGCR